MNLAKIGIIVLAVVVAYVAYVWFFPDSFENTTDCFTPLSGQMTPCK